LFRIVCDLSSGSIELYLTETRSGSLMFVVCLVGVWQRNFEPVVCVCVCVRYTHYIPLHVSSLLSAHLQEDTIVCMQHMVLSLSTRVRGGLSVHSCAPTGHHELWQYHMLHAYNCTFLKMSNCKARNMLRNIIFYE